MGERNYYAKQINKLQDINKSLGVSMVVTTIIMAFAYAFIVLIFIFSQGTEEAYELWKFIIWSTVFALCVGFVIVFYTIIKPSNKKKIIYYRHELERISAQALYKVSKTYSFYGNKGGQQTQDKVEKKPEKTEESDEVKGDNQPKTDGEDDAKA